MVKIFKKKDTERKIDAKPTPDKNEEAKGPITEVKSKNISFELGVSPVWGKKSLKKVDKFLTSETLDRYKILPSKATEVARKLVAEGITIYHIGEYSISAACSEEKFEAFFKTRLSTVEKPKDPSLPEEIVPQGEPDHAPPEKTRLKAPRKEKLRRLIDQVYVQQRPTFFSGERALAPNWADKFRLRIPGDIAQLLNASSIHRKGINGKGVTVAIVDTGCYYHPYFTEQGYNFLSVTAPDTADYTSDETGHGTGIAATLLAVAPDVNFISVKMGSPVLAVKTAIELKPDIIICGWGYGLDQPESEMPEWLRPLQIAILDGIAKGVTFCVAAGNGQHAFPGNLPEVISVGGVFVDEGLKLLASSYTSSYSSSWFPGRYVPDVCGLCGEKPKADYIALPVQAQATLEKDRGWGSFSGTSSAAAQVGGVCALLKQVAPHLTPADIKKYLQYTATDIVSGNSKGGDTAEKGWDPATGFGLVHAKRALEIVL